MAPNGAAFARLAQPIRVGAVTLRNRIVMGSMHTGLEGHQTEASFDQLARFYAARAKGGVGLIVTGGFAPNEAGRLKDEPATMQTTEQVRLHCRITDAVHGEGGLIVLQLLHAGRYGYHDRVVAPSPVRSPINKHVPGELSEAAIEQTIADYVRSARLARDAGYDGVEVMGSEGYLISQFLAPRTNHRTDRWGGVLESRARFAIAVVGGIRAVLPDFLIVYRHSVLDLIEGGLPWHETVCVAQEVAGAGADAVSTGFGWHEARVPTIAGVVPHAAFAEHVRRLKATVPVPVIASNRINSPQVAERLIASGTCDLVSMARPLLADAEFVNKALAGGAKQITVCIACNQACLDHYFENRPITCLVNPRAAREAEFRPLPMTRKKRIAVVGAGVAGLVCAIEAARRGHDVVLFEAERRIGGQMTLAARIPGKADYADVLRAYEAQLEDVGTRIYLGRRATAPQLLADGFDEIIIATGVRPRTLDLPGADDPHVVSYDTVLSGKVGEVGTRVVIIGAGGIGHDVALYLAHPDPAEAAEPARFAHRWGVGGVPSPAPARRQVTLLKRSPGPFGRTLGKSTGWILRQELRDLGVQQLAGVTYHEIDEAGLHVTIEGQQQCVTFDTLVVCAGQVPDRSLADELIAAGREVHMIGGAKFAVELDAQRAIEEGIALGCAI